MNKSYYFDDIYQIVADCLLYKCSNSIATSRHVLIVLVPLVVGVKRFAMLQHLRRRQQRLGKKERNVKIHVREACTKSNTHAEISEQRQTQQSCSLLSDFDSRYSSICIPCSEISGDFITAGIKAIQKKAIKDASLCLQALSLISYMYRLCWINYIRAAIAKCPISLTSGNEHPPITNQKKILRFGFFRCLWLFLDFSYRI